MNGCVGKRCADKFARGTNRFDTPDDQRATQYNHVQLVEPLLLACQDESLRQAVGDVVAALEARLDVAEVPAVEVEDVLVQVLRSSGHTVREPPQEWEEIDRV